MIVSTAQAGEDNLAAWECGVKFLHQLSLRISERRGLGCSYGATMEATTSFQWSLIKWPAPAPITSFRCLHQRRSSAELITQIWDRRLVKSLLFISALTSPSVVRGWEKENLGAKQHPAMPSCVLLRDLNSLPRTSLQAEGFLQA